jgi:hypothetical protein
MLINRKNLPMITKKYSALYLCNLVVLFMSYGAMGRIESIPNPLGALAATPKKIEPLSDKQAKLYNFQDKIRRSKATAQTKTLRARQKTNAFVGKLVDDTIVSWGRDHAKRTKKQKAAIAGANIAINTAGSTVVAAASQGVTAFTAPVAAVTAAGAEVVNYGKNKAAHSYVKRKLKEKIASDIRQERGENALAAVTDKSVNRASLAQTIDKTLDESTLKKLVNQRYNQTYSLRKSNRGNEKRVDRLKRVVDDVSDLDLVGSARAKKSNEAIDSKIKNIQTDTLLKTKLPTNKAAYGASTTKEKTQKIVKKGAAKKTLKGRLAGTVVVAAPGLAVGAVSDAAGSLGFRTALNVAKLGGKLAYEGYKQAEQSDLSQSLQTYGVRKGAAEYKVMRQERKLRKSMESDAKKRDKQQVDVNNLTPKIEMQKGLNQDSMSNYEKEKVQSRIGKYSSRLNTKASKLAESQEKAEESKAKFDEFATSQNKVDTQKITNLNTRIDNVNQAIEKLDQKDNDIANKANQSLKSQHKHAKRLKYKLKKYRRKQLQKKLSKQKKDLKRRRKIRK